MKMRITAGQFDRQALMFLTLASVIWWLVFVAVAG